jgi:hypothetical protein
MVAIRGAGCHSGLNAARGRIYLATCIRVPLEVRGKNPFARPKQLKGRLAAIDRTGERNLAIARPFLAFSPAFICRGPILLATRSSTDWSSSHEFLVNIAAALTANPYL